MSLLPRADGGIVRGPLPEDTTRTSILVAMLTLAIYMSALVDLKAFTLFKRRNTLYFWSLLVTSWGIMSHSLGIILKWFAGSCPWQVNTAFASFGWWGMVTGQSLVLYSRLHLVVRDHRILRAVLIMIMTNFIIFQVPTTIQTFGSNQANPGLWLTVYNIYERIQLVVFTLQEFIISSIYIRAAVKLLTPTDPTETTHTKKFLIYLNMLCIGLDVAFVCEVFSGEWVYKTGTQSLAYAIKLTIEFAVLNKLMEVYQFGPGSCSACRRKFTQGPSHDGAVYGSSAWRRPSMIRQANSSQPSGDSVLGNWSRSSHTNLTKGAERLGPLEEEEMIGTSSSLTMGVETNVRGGMVGNGLGAKEGDIVVTTGISSWSEGTEGKNGQVNTASPMN